MAKNEVGEFELVLGNKQLLSVFFIVVILLGVFFTMGYIVGRNSGGVGMLEAGNRKTPEPKATIVDSPNAPQPTQVATANEPEPKKEEPKKEEPPPAPIVEVAKPVEPPKVEEKKPEPKEEKKEEKKAEKKKKEAAAVEPAPASTGALSGTYLQLAAVPKSEADLLVSVLRKKGFSAAAGPGPKESNLFRVLVGPLTVETVSSTRTQLTDAGMPGAKAIVRKF